MIDNNNSSDSDDGDRFNGLRSTGTATHLCCVNGRGLLVGVPLPLTTTFAGLLVGVPLPLVATFADLLVGVSSSLAAAFAFFAGFLATFLGGMVQRRADCNEETCFWDGENGLGKVIIFLTTFLQVAVGSMGAAASQLRTRNSFLAYLAMGTVDCPEQMLPREALLKSRLLQLTLLHVKIYPVRLAGNSPVTSMLWSMASEHLHLRTLVQAFSTPCTVPN